MKSVSTALRATLALVVLIAAQATVASAADLVVPVVTSLTGPFAFVGKQEADALALLEKSTNAAGGYKGQHIHFDVQDDTSNPQVDVQLVNGLIARGATVILGPTSVGGCLAIAPLTRTGPVVYCMSPGVKPDPGSFMFSAGVSSDDIMAAFTNYFRDARLRRVATLWTTDASGQEAEREFDGHYLGLRDNASMQLTSNDHFNPADLSVTARNVEDCGKWERAVVFVFRNGFTVRRDPARVQHRRVENSPGIINREHDRLADAAISVTGSRPIRTPRHAL